MQITTVAINQPNTACRASYGEAASANPGDLVSICIPVFNCERYIGMAIESALGQTYRNLELIITDNCSTDGTFSVTGGYRHDPRVRIFQNESNLGIAGNCNRALGLAKGKYVKLLCADDFLYPDCVEVQTGILADPCHETVAMVFCRRDIVAPDGKRLFTWGYSGKPGRYRGLDLLRQSVRRGTNIFGEPGGVMFAPTRCRGPEASHKGSPGCWISISGAVS